MLSDGLLRVFWPNDIPKSTSPGVIVGWRNSEFDLFVLTVFEHVEVRPGHSFMRVKFLTSCFPLSHGMSTMPCELASCSAVAPIPFLG